MSRNIEKLRFVSIQWKIKWKCKFEHENYEKFEFLKNYLLVSAFNLQLLFIDVLPDF